MGPKEECDVWRKETSPRGWRLAMLPVPPINEVSVKALEALLEDLRGRAPFDPRKVYLAGRGDFAAGVFFAISRAPHLWAAGVAVGGDAKAAVNTDRLFAANAQLVPILWMVHSSQRAAVEPARRKLQAANFPFTFDDAQNPFAFLAQHSREEFPAKVDCETGNRMFVRCYWMEATGIDPSRRNDAIRSTRVTPDLLASLDLGGFGYQPGKPGPGVLVEWLPPNYSGPLQLNDRIVAISGKTVHDSREYVEMMEQERAERPAAIMVERGKERIRLQTRVLMPKREEVITVRMQGEYLPQSNDLFIVSRGVSEAKITLPERWVPANINWNGQPITRVDAAGCYVISEGKAGGARACSP
jgi:hypothetical protein